MDVFMILSLLGGLAMFLYGMDVMGKGLEKISGSKLGKILEKMTANPVKGVLCGTIVTAFLQSSSATTVMVVGFVNSGLMKLAQSVGITMGANIGTTITAWILCLSEVQGESFWLQLVKPSSFVPVFATIGMIFILFLKKGKKRDVGTILVGFAVLMFGMTMMSDAVRPLAEDENFRNLLMVFTNPVLGVLAGLILTALLQSSSASVGILQALSATGSLTFGAAIPIIMGQNIGACATALISSVGTKKDAKRAALIHLFFNVIGTVLFLGVYYIGDIFLDYAFTGQSIDAVNIALLHTLFNVITTVILLPLSKLLIKLTQLVVRNKPDSSEIASQLDERFFKTPAYAVERCRKLTCEMGTIAKDTFLRSFELLEKYDEKLSEQIEADESRLDTYEDELGSYLIRLSAQPLTDEDSRCVSILLHCISDFERIGDHAVNNLHFARKLSDQDGTFSPEARAELSVVVAAVTEILQLTVHSFVNHDAPEAAKVEPLEQVIDYLTDEARSRHITRLQNGNCTINMGLILTDILNSIERTSDHCSNVAVCVLQEASRDFNTHDFLNKVKNSGQPEFMQNYAAYSQKYALN